MQKKLIIIISIIVLILIIILFGYFFMKNNKDILNVSSTENFNDINISKNETIFNVLNNTETINNVIANEVNRKTSGERDTTNGNNVITNNAKNTISTNTKKNETKENNDSNNKTNNYSNTNTNSNNSSIQNNTVSNTNSSKTNSETTTENSQSNSNSNTNTVEDTEEKGNPKLANTHFAKYNASKTGYAVNYINNKMKQDEYYEMLGGKVIAVTTKPCQDWFSYSADYKLDWAALAGLSVKVYVEDEYRYDSKGINYYLFDTKAYITQTLSKN